MFEQRLRRFFEGVGAYHASNILRDLEHEMPLMRRYPEIVVSEIGRFRSYLVDAPSDNLSATFQILHRIAREVPEARDRIIRDLGDVLFEYKGVMDDSTNAPVLTALLDTLELPISERDGQIKAIARSIVTLKQPIILVIGAGFSYDRMPVTSELGPLLVPLLKAEGITNPSEFLRTHDKEVWQIVKRNARSFKERFIGWSARAVPSSQHSTAVEMLHDGRITHLVSFNWDDLLERSYTEQYGEAIPKVTTDGVKVEGPAMWKLHGDVEQPSEDWVFPYEDGRVFKTLMESLEEALAKTHPAHALIIGYSEWESEVKERLIGWLEQNIPNVFRVRPNWPDDNPSGMAETAKRFLQRLRIYSQLESRA